MVAEAENVVYDYRVTVSCVGLATGKQREMAYRGFEASRQTLKYGCPSVHYCKAVPPGNRPKGLYPIARSSYRWKREYHKRTAMERINSRLDRSFGFELQTTRGAAKMAHKLTLPFSVLLAVALGRVNEQQAALMRSLVRPAV